MRKFFVWILIAFFLFPVDASAVTFDLNSPRAVISAESTVQVNKNIILSASQSFVPDPEAEVTYEWDFGDKSQKGKGVEAVHSYRQPGEYLVTLTVTQKGESSPPISKNVFVYEKLILLITDVTDRQVSVKQLTDTALAQGTYINAIDSYDSTTAFMSEEALSKKLADQVGGIGNVEMIAIWTTRGSGINALTRLVRERPDIQPSLADKTIVVITEKNLGTLGRIMQSNFDIIKPKQIIITREHKLEDMIKLPTAAAFVQSLATGVAEYSIINEQTRRISIWNSISYLVNFMITQGIPSNTIVLLLMLPVIATLIAFLKQVIGVTTFGLYTPSIITLSFLALGLKFGLAILFIILITGAILRKVLGSIRLLHIPRIAIVFSISTLILLLMLAFGAYLGIRDLSSIAVFPMLIVATLAEKFVSAQTGKGFFAAVFLMVETAAVSLICYWVVEWQFLQNLMLSYPEIILLLILVNYGLGRWTGLRFFEYVRFREVMKHAEE